MQPHKTKYSNSKVVRDDMIIIKEISYKPLCMCINLYYFPLSITLTMNENSQSNLIEVNSAHFSLIFSNSNNTYTMRGAANNSKEQTIKLKFLTWLFDSHWAKFTSSITLWEFALWEIFLATFFLKKRKKRKAFLFPFLFLKGELPVTVPLMIRRKK